MGVFFKILLYCKYTMINKITKILYHILVLIKESE